jgi:predicted GNAT family acetyltransferase
MEFTFRHSEENAKGLFEILKGEETFARMTYSRIDDNNIIIDHTGVLPSAKGTGAGKRIVMHAVEWAREHGQKIMPLCPFAKAVIEKNLETHDILRK